MKTRWGIPAAVALALHAFVLFGFRSPPRHAGPPACVARIERDPLVSLTEIANPPDPTDADVAPAGGAPDVPRSGEAVTAPREDPQTFTLVAEPPRPGPITAARIIPEGPPGPGEGNERGPGNQVIRASSLDHPPKTRLQASPIYPYEARNNGRMGEVLVEFTVDESGRVLNPHVIRSTDPLFELPTLRAVAKWRFEPGRKNGRAVRFRMALPVQFTVDSREGA